MSHSRATSATDLPPSTASTIETRMSTSPLCRGARVDLPGDVPTSHEPRTGWLRRLSHRVASLQDHPSDVPCSPQPETCVSPEPRYADPIPCTR